MDFKNFFSFSGSNSSYTELPEVFPLAIHKDSFVKTDVINIYTKILTDVVERTQGIKDENLASLWDNCLKSENNEGLITMLATAMADKKDLFIVWDKTIKLLVRANQEQQRQIEADYAKQGRSSVGTYISFKKYDRSDMVKLYSALEYCAIGALNKNMNVSNALQLKMHDLRGSVALTEKGVAEDQAKGIANGLKKGQAVLLDAKDIIEMAKPDMTATTAAMEFINERRSFYLCMPASYITGQLSKGISDTGEGDAKAVERGLKNYYFSIIKPVVESVFNIKTTFESEDFRQIDSALNVLKTFELTSDEYMAKENKLLIVNKMFGLPEDTEGGPEPEPVKVEPNPATPPPQPNETK